MPQTETVYKVFISSPSDLKEERKKLKTAIEGITLSEGRLKAVRWEDDLPSVTTENAQTEINKLLNECDIVCGIFKGKFGSPTAEYDSGTVEEIEFNIERKKPVMLYFLNHTISSNSTNEKEIEEMAKIQGFKKKYQKKGIYHECKNIDEIIEQFLKLDIAANIERIPQMSPKAYEDQSETKPFAETNLEDRPWYMARIAVLINKYIEEKHLNYKYIEDLTFHENLLLARGENTNYLQTTVQNIMESARIEAFNVKYGNYNYDSDIRSRFSNWADPIYEIIEQAFPRRKVLNVLDVGGNYGIELSQIFSNSKYTCKTTVVDLSNTAIERGKKTFPNIEYVQANMEDFSLDTKKLFDVCFCLRAISSRGVIRNDALIQMSKHIKPNGFIFVSIPNGYIDENDNIIKGLYDHRTRSFLKVRPITLARKVFVKLGDYNFVDIGIKSLDTEILVYAKEGEQFHD